MCLNLHSCAESLNLDLNCGPPSQIITPGMPFSLNIPLSSLITVPVLGL